MIPDELKKEIVSDVESSMKFLKVLGAVKNVRGDSVENTKFYKSALSRFRRSVIPASSKLHAVSFYVEKEEFDGFLKELGCTWDSENHKIVLPETH